MLVLCYREPNVDKRGTIKSKENENEMSINKVYNTPSNIIFNHIQLRSRAKQIKHNSFVTIYIYLHSEKFIQ